MKQIFIFLLFVFTSIQGQNISSWQNYTNMKNINSIFIQGNNVWAGSNGGVFNYSKTDSIFQKLTKSEGLSGQTITAISIDNDKKIWIGTIEGFIDVYDPTTNQIKTILEINKTNKNLKSINDITISGDTAFISTDFGLSLINTNNLSFYDSALKFGSFVTETPVQNVFLGSTIYVVTNLGIALKKFSAQNLSSPDAWNNIDLGSQIPADKIYKIIEYDNHLFAATNKGLIKQTDSLWQTILHNNSNVFDLVVIDNHLYSLLENTIHKYDNTTDEVVFNMSSTLFSEFDFYDGTFFIASNKGLIETDLQNSKVIFPNGPEVNAIIDIDVDQNGNLWSGTGDDVSGVGVLKFDGNVWTLLNKDNTSIFESNSFHKVSAAEDAIYFSNWGKGFTRFEDDIYEQFDANNTDIEGITDAPNFIVIDDIVKDSKGNTWVLNFWSGSKKPLSVLTAEGKWNHFQFASPLSSAVVLAENLIVDQYSTKWFAVKGKGIQGLYYFNENGTFENLSDDVWGRITTSNGLRDKDVNAIAVDQFGELIIGTSIGVDVIPDPSNPSSIRSDQYFAIRQQTINCLAVDPINQKWFGTTKGIFLMTSDGSRLIANYNSSNSPLPNDNIKTIAIDEDKGIIYIGTDFGLTAVTTLFVKPNSDFSQLFVYPNPIAIDGNTNSNILIDGLVEDSEIKILDISGNLINEFFSIGGRTTVWNLKDLDNKLVASGVYIIVAFDSEANQVSQTKVAVIRK